MNLGSHLIVSIFNNKIKSFYFILESHKNLLRMTCDKNNEAERLQFAYRLSKYKTIHIYIQINIEKE